MVATQYQMPARDASAVGGVPAAYREALEALARANRTRPDPMLERALIDLRITTFRACPWPAPLPVAHKHRPRTPNGQLLEIDAADLNAEVLADGVLAGGGLIVRGLMDEARVSSMRDCIDATLAARRDLQRDETAADPRWYHRSPLISGGPQQFWAGKDVERYDDFGSVWAVDSPAGAQLMAEFYHAIGLPKLLRECLGEDGVLSVKKWVFRKVKPKTEGQSGWHQDGKFLGDGIRTVNLWVPLSHCGGGTPAPGMEIVADRRKVIHETGTRGAMLDWVVGQELVDELAQDTPVLTPAFRPGDALFFDHYNLHRTQSDASQSDLRYAVESWFFAASSAPAKQLPLVL